MNSSKPLGHDDTSGFEFAKEMLAGDVTAAVNFDRLQKHPKQGYIIFEYLLCEESQRVTPYTSHPKRYWNKNKRKFIKLWKVAVDLNATLYLVNYAKKGTKAENEILLIEVLDLDDNGIKNEKTTKMTRSEFQQWFRQLNKECLEDTEETQKKQGLSFVMQCPNCKSTLRHTENGFFCKKRCGMMISSFYGEKLTDQQVVDLLGGKNIEFTDSKGNKYIIHPKSEGPKDGRLGGVFFNWKSEKI